MQFVITGFDAFDTADVNPTQQAVDQLNRDLLNSFNVPQTVGYVKHTLSTCCENAWAVMEHLVESLPEDEPFAIIMCGVAGNRSRICLERFALNVRNYRVSDNGGHQWQEDYIDVNAPNALRTTIPLIDLKSHLNQLGLMAEVSDYAGSFVCNETYFRSLQKWGPSNRCKGIVFVHFPNLLDYLGTNGNGLIPLESDECKNIACAALAEYLRAIAEIVKFIEAGSRTSPAALEA